MKKSLKIPKADLSKEYIDKELLGKAPNISSIKSLQNLRTAVENGYFSIGNPKTEESEERDEK